GLVALKAEYLDHLQGERALSSSTVEAYGRDLGELIDFLDGVGVQRAGEISEGALLAYQARLHKLGRAPASIKRKLAAVRTFFQFAYREGALAAPIDGLEPPRLGRKLPKVLTREEVLTLLHQPNTEETTGLRDKA